MFLLREKCSLNYVSTFFFLTVCVISQVSREEKKALGTMQGSYQYPDGSNYSGKWSEDGQRHGLGQMSFPDGARYHGNFAHGLCEGLGVMIFSDNSR